MKKKRRKIAKLTDEQYIAYIMSLKDDAPLYSADGNMVVPDSLKAEEEDEKI